MIPYWLLFGLFALGALLARPDFRRDKPVGSLWIGVFVLTLMIGLRYRTGVDWLNYYRQWVSAAGTTLPQLIQDHGGDSAFYTLMWALSRLGLGYWSLNLVCGTVFTLGLTAFARRLPNPWLAVAVAIPYLGIVIAMSGTRQATAIGFVFFALVAFMEKRTRAFIAWTLVASLFHASAILTLPLAGLSFARNRFQAILWLSAIVLVGFVFLGAPFATYTLHYFTETLQSSGTIYRIAINLLASLLYLLLIARRADIPDHERALWRNFALAALAAIPLLPLVPSSTSLDRLMLYLTPLQIFALTMLPYTALRGTSPAVIILPILAYLAAILFVFLNFAVNAEFFIPYRMYLWNAG
ncbi:MAG TPA: EpsG family protein [Sphingomicrobium sp.]|nr:EpsG family protein [Sphingomicrobium sp.]